MSFTVPAARFDDTSSKRSLEVLLSSRFLCDDPSGQSVVVCQPDRARAEAAAKGCAQSAAPAPVQRCRCSSMAGATGSEPCKSGYCNVKEHR